MEKQVLIVDDDPVSLSYLEGLLTFLSYKVETCDNGLSAWEKIQSIHYEFIILDMEMPGMNGIELAGKIRDLYGENCMIMMMTGHEDLNVLGEALTQGADEYIVKPVDLKTLKYRLHIVENQLDKLHTRLHVQQELARSQEYYHAIFQNSSFGVLILDISGKIIEYNDTLAKISGYLTITLRDNFVIHCVHKNESQKIKNFFRNLLNDYKKFSRIETVLISRSGLELNCVFTANLVESPDPEKNFIMVMIEDITDKKKFEDELKYNALHDPLTGLPNRDLFYDRLNKLITVDLASRENSFAVLILDVDRFQLINETLGHSKGDILINLIARRISELIGSSDTIARLTGDEFGILTEKYRTVAQLTHFIHKIQTAMKDKFMIGENEITISTSIGIKVYEGMEDSASGILRDADAALHRAKARGWNSYAFFMQKMTQESRQTLKMEIELRKAVENNDLELYYQPQLDLSNRHIIGVEALLRWNHPELGNVPPKIFIPLAEHTGLIVPLGDWILTQAISKCLEWESKEIAPLKIAVNFSSIQFKEMDLVPFLSQKLEPLRKCQNTLQIEMTESVFMENPRHLVDIIRKLKTLGVQLAIDDFGTGFSSLSYLRSLPISIVKIDMSFIENLVANESDRSLVMAIISMAHSMKMKTVAEGVETNEQLLILQAMFCDIIQGYHLSKPLREDDFLKFISEKTNKMIYGKSEQLKYSKKTV